MYQLERPCVRQYDLSPFEGSLCLRLVAEPRGVHDDDLHLVGVQCSVDSRPDDDLLDFQPGDDGPLDHGAEQLEANNPKQNNVHS